ncbi:MAG: peptidoglycan-binding protein [Defluviicoccus sp.]|nr:MAG: peptidoglycan-binding protein [Defluviicoccus sp.]
MIRFLVCFECVLLALVLVGRLGIVPNTPEVLPAVASSGAGSGAGSTTGSTGDGPANAAEGAAEDPSGTARPAHPLGARTWAMHHNDRLEDDRRASAHDLLSVGAAPAQPHFQVQVKPQPEEIATVQRLLIELGYQPGPADGALGLQTEQAIRAYQQRSGEHIDGQFSEQLLSRLQRDAHQLASVSRNGA